jgi:hypothetical protein
MSIHQSPIISDPTAAPGFGPPLEPGDRLTRAEFERRYDAMPHLKKAELINEGEYQRQQPGGDGLVRSHVFPGLWLDVAALLRGDLAAVLAALQHGLKSSEHAEFVKRLGKRQLA